jgi:hypothetical protein
MIRGQKSTMDAFRKFASENLLTLGDALTVLMNGWNRLSSDQQSASRKANQEPKQ